MCNAVIEFGRRVNILPLRLRWVSSCILPIVSGSCFRLLLARLSLVSLYSMLILSGSSLSVLYAAFSSCRLSNVPAKYLLISPMVSGNDVKLLCEMSSFVNL